MFILRTITYVINLQYSTTTYKNSIAYSTVIGIKGNTVFCMVPVNYGMYGHGTQNWTTEGSTTKRVRAEFELKERHSNPSSPQLLE